MANDQERIVGWYIRDKDDDDYEPYYDMPNLFTIRLHHGGKLTKSPGRTYERGSIDYVDYIDIDLLSMHEISDMVCVQKDTSVEHNMFVLSSLPKPPKCSNPTPLFIKAKCHQYIFDDAIKPNQLDLDSSARSYGSFRRPKRILDLRTTYTTLKARALGINNKAGSTPRCVVLDIEGTTTPISFVTDVLFPYACDNVRMHLEETYDSVDTKDDIKLLRSQVEEDLQKGVVGAVPVPSDDAGKEDVIAALVANVEEMIKADRKITSLKQLQGHIWRTGFEKNEIKGVVYDDVPQAFERWHASGVKVYIYSSGSRLAQRLIFGYTNFGDLRKYLCGFFDTRVGNKRETQSYIEISESLGVDKPSDILFVTDVIQEAVAAKAAGLEVIISVRPGNGLLPDNHGFDTIETFTEIPF